MTYRDVFLFLCSATHIHMVVGYASSINCNSWGCYMVSYEDTVGVTHGDEYSLGKQA